MYIYTHKLEFIKIQNYYSHLTIIFLAYFCQSIINNYTISLCPSFSRFVIRRLSC